MSDTEEKSPQQMADEIGLNQCPNGCGFDMIEIGKEDQSFHAAISLPFQFIRCGECGFNDKTDDFMPEVANDQAGAVEKWNDAVASRQAV